MKKILLLLFLLTLVTGMIFSQTVPGLNLEARFDAIWVPFQYINRDVAAPGGGRESVNLFGSGLGRLGGAEGPRLTLFAQGGNEYAGFDVELFFRPDIITPNLATAHAQFTIMSGDEFSLWVQPFGDNRLKISLGKYIDNTLKGKYYEFWTRRFILLMEDSNTIFAGFDGHGPTLGPLQSQVGAMVSSRINRFYFGVNMPCIWPFNIDPGSWSNLFTNHGVYEVVFNPGGSTNPGKFNNLRAWERLQFGVGYFIHDLGLARLQFVGDHYGFHTNFFNNIRNIQLVNQPLEIYSPRVEAAFYFDRESSGLNFDIGFKYYFPFTADKVKTFRQNSLFDENEVLYIFEQHYDTAVEDFRVQPNFQVSIGANYNLWGLLLRGRVDTRFGGSFEQTKLAGADVSNQKISFPFEINAHLYPQYNLGFMNLIFNIGVAWTGAHLQGGNVYKKTDDLAGWDGGLRVGYGIFGQRTFRRRSFIRAGFTYRHGFEVNGFREDRVFSIPIEVQSTF